MEITKLSTKGQIIIPEKMRKGIEVGTPFIVTKKDNLIILKSVEGLTKEEQEEVKELNEIWKDIDAGNCETYSVKEFFAKMKEW